LEIGIGYLLEDRYGIKLLENKPFWLNSIKTVYERKLLSRDEIIQSRISKLWDSIVSINLEIDDERKVKKILYTDGSELEESIKFTFQRMNLRCRETKISEEDCFIENTMGSFLFEIKGCDSYVRKKGLRQLWEWKDKIEELGFVIDRSVFIVNHFKTIPIEDRPFPFEQNIVRDAEGLNLLLMTTVDLFKIYNLFLNNKINTNEICSLLKASPTIFKLS